MILTCCFCKRREQSNYLLEEVTTFCGFDLRYSIIAMLCLWSAIIAISLCLWLPILLSVAVVNLALLSAIFVFPQSRSVRMINHHVQQIGLTLLVVLSPSFLVLIETF